MSSTSENCADLYRNLTEAGHAIRLTSDGRLAVSGASTLTDADRARIRAHRAALLAWLSPLERFGPQAAADAVTLSEILKTRPCAGLSETMRLCAECGVTGDRFALACVALPPADSPDDLGATS